MILAVLSVLAAAVAAQDRPLVIRTVTVIPATGDSARLATLLIADGRIVAIAPANRTAPRGSMVVNGTGKYLIPGLFDLHTHVSKSRGSSLGLFVANGVTTLRDMGGDHQELLRWRREITTGARVGPRMLIAGPYLESPANVARQRGTPVAEMAEPVERTRVPVGSPEEAVRVIDSLAALGVDHIKIRTVHNRDTYRAIVAAARARGLPLVGHPYGSFDLMIEAGQRSVEHGLLPVSDTSVEGRMLLWRRLAEARVGVVPTMVTATESGLPSAERLREIADDSLGSTGPWRRYLANYLVVDWREQASEQSDERRAFVRGSLPRAVRNLREMREAGVRIMPGTDAAVINIFPGASLHDELALFVSELGFTPLQAIEAATRVSAEFLGLGDSLGTIEPNQVADLVLLDADPRADIRNTRRIVGVVLRGRWYSRADLDRLLETVLSAPDRAVNDWARQPQR